MRGSLLAVELREPKDRGRSGFSAVDSTRSRPAFLGARRLDAARRMANGVTFTDAAIANRSDPA